MGGLVSTLIIGLVVGLLAAHLMKKQNMGWGMCIVLGVIGSAVGNFIFSAIGIAAFGLIGQVLIGVVGACVVLFAVGKMKNP